MTTTQDWTGNGQTHTDHGGPVQLGSGDGAPSPGDPKRGDKLFKDFHSCQILASELAIRAEDLREQAGTAAVTAANTVRAAMLTDAAAYLKGKG